MTDEQQRHERRRVLTDQQKGRSIWPIFIAEDEVQGSRSS